MGEAVLRDIANKRGLDTHIDSCGTGAYHIGEDPDDRTVAICKKVLWEDISYSLPIAIRLTKALQHDVAISHKARTIAKSDFKEFTHILAADGSNLRSLESFKPEDATAEVRLWGSYHDDHPIGDPYYGGLNGFEKVYQQCVTFSNAFLDEVFGKPTSSSGGDSDL
ncbi:phosphotyrosine protein phosphatases I [Marasmius fiardii PR-910]|nr:phosphotyrosine protein phosphatases I [Marasmius fiardii PR-910]